MNKLNNLIETALEKAKQDLNNEKIEVHYTPEFLIGLLTELKETLTPKEKVDVYEIRKEYSTHLGHFAYYIYKNNHYISMGLSMEVAIDRLDEIKKNTKVEVLHREEVANV